MKKQGFTLAELLIALGVIGVAAALLVPNLGKILPDRNKITVLNTAKVINEITTNLMNNDGLYYNINRCVGLACNATPKTAPYNDNKYSGDSKYSRLLISNLNVDGDVNEEANASAFKFKTTDGVFWTVTPTAITGGATIMIDVNGESKGKNCSFNTSSCKKPDQYVFVVDQMGKLHPGDPLTAAYTMNQTKTKNKKNDYTLAANFSDKTKDWQGLTLVVGKDRTDKGCVGDECKDDPCKGLSERECYCKKNPEECRNGGGGTPGNIDPPGDCEGLTERECFCKKNVGACEDPCKYNPNLPKCSKPEKQPDSDPCAGKTGLEKRCCVNPNLWFCDGNDYCATHPDALQCQTDPCKNLTVEECKCKTNPYLPQCKGKELCDEDILDFTETTKPSYCLCKLHPEMGQCNLTGLTIGGTDYAPPKDYNACFDNAVTGLKCYYDRDAKMWYTEPNSGGNGLDNSSCKEAYGKIFCYGHGNSGSDGRNTSGTLPSKRN